MNSDATNECDDLPCVEFLTKLTNVNNKDGTVTEADFKHGNIQATLTINVVNDAMIYLYLIAFAIVCGFIIIIIGIF